MIETLTSSPNKRRFMAHCPCRQVSRLKSFPPWTRRSAPIRGRPRSRRHGCTPAYSPVGQPETAASALLSEPLVIQGDREPTAGAGAAPKPNHLANRRWRWPAYHLCLARSRVRLALVPSIASPLSLSSQAIAGARGRPTPAVNFFQASTAIANLLHQIPYGAHSPPADRVFIASSRPGLVCAGRMCCRPPRCDYSSRMVASPPARLAYCRGAWLRRRGRSGGMSSIGDVSREGPVETKSRRRARTGGTPLPSLAPHRESRRGWHRLPFGGG